ncbi:MAG: tyrosine-protein phosphatase [Cryobacterium sp.]|nr:tyrosine-protein phosphatase [Cryobacterium sp.]
MTSSEAVNPQQRAVVVEGLRNVRDLGGQRRTAGGVTPMGVFFRSENLDLVTEEGWQELYTLGVRTVVDLRQPIEGEQAKYATPSWITVEFVDHDGLVDHPGFWSGYWGNGLVSTPLYYLPHLEQLPERSADVLRVIARARPGGVLFHCAGGRDRTGIISMLLQVVAGAESAAVVEDYLESVRNGGSVSTARGRPDTEPEKEDLCRAHGTSTEAAFRAVLDALDVELVLKNLTAADRAAIQSWRGSI